MKKYLLSLVFILSFTKAQPQSLGSIAILSTPGCLYAGLQDTIKASLVPGAQFYHWFFPSPPQSGNILFGPGGCCLAPYNSPFPNTPIIVTGSLLNQTICVYAFNSCCTTDTACITIISTPPIPVMSPSNSPTAIPNSSGIYSVLPPSPIYSCVAVCVWNLIPTSAGTITGNGNDTVTINFSSSFTSCMLCAHYQTTFNLNGPDTCMTITTPVGVNEFANAGEEFSLSPNPANDFLLISDYLILKEVEITIFDFLGKKVLQQIINHQSSIINIQSLSPGMYFLEINGIRKKFIRQ